MQRYGKLISQATYRNDKHAVLSFIRILTDANNDSHECYRSNLSVKNLLR